MIAKVCCSQELIVDVEHTEKLFSHYSRFRAAALQPERMFGQSCTSSSAMAAAACITGCGCRISNSPVIIEHFTLLHAPGSHALEAALFPLKVSCPGPLQTQESCSKVLNNVL